MAYFIRIDICRSKRLTFIILLLVFFALSPPGLALNPHKKITQYMHDTWRIKQGLPQNTINAVVQTPDGYLWLGTEEGLVRFDGVHFQVYDKNKVEQIANNNVLAYYQDRQGNLWTGTHGGGLIRLDAKDKKFTAYTKKQGLSNDRVRAICEDRQGNLWIGTDHGLNCFKEGKFTVYTTRQGLSGNNITAIYEDREGNLWIGTYGSGLNHFKNGTFTFYTTENGLSNNNVRTIYEDRLGDLWIGTYGGLNLMRNGKFTWYTTREGLSDNKIKVLYQDRAGNLWIGTYGGGLDRMNRQDFPRKHEAPIFTSFTSEDGLSNDFVKSIYEDREGSLWVGTSDGLNRLKDGKFTAFTSKEGLVNDMVRCIYEDRAGALWMGTTDGLNRLQHLDAKDEIFTLYTTKQGLSGNYVLSIYEDRKGCLWIGTYSGLNCMEHGAFTSYTTKDGLSDGMVRCLQEDRQGRLWIGTNNGLNRLGFHEKKPAFITYTTKNGLSNDVILSLLQDRDGPLWIGTTEGLNRLDFHENAGAFTSYTSQNGLSNDVILSLHQDREGYLWVGTESGLDRWKDGKFSNVTVKDGLPDDKISRLLEDDRGNFWISSNKGVFRVSKKELNDFCDGKSKNLHCVSYDEKDGMKSRECNGGTQPAGWKSRDGKLWFPTIKGIVMSDPNNIKTNPIPPPVKIEAITADNNTMLPPFPMKENEGKLVLSPGKERVEIRYTALSFLVPDRVRFKFKLEGFDQEWRRVGTRRTAYYPKLPPGDYTFRVKACNDDGIWNETGASVSFYLKPYFYQTWWFYMICVCAVVFFTLGIYRLRVKHLQKRKIELEKANEIARKEREIADAANRAKSEFLARMSHELRTPMNAVIGFADMLMNTGLTGEQLDYTRIIRRSSEALTLLLKDILDYSMLEAGELEMVSSDFDAKMTVRNVCEMVRPRLEGKPVEMRFHIGDNVPAYVKGDGQRFLQVLLNLLSNAAKFTKEGEIELSLHVEEEQKERIKFHVTVRDTGIGIPADKLEVIFAVFHQLDGADSRRYGGSGVGLSIARQIAKLMGGDVRAESTPGKGSIFHFTAWMDKSGKKPEKEIIPAHSPAKEIPAADEKKPPAHILLAEDNPINRKLASFILTRAGYRLTTVNDGKEAVDTYTSAPDRFHLILMDIQMPVMDGREATRKIREIESSTIRDQTAARKWHIPIIAITAQSMTGDREKCIEAGMDDYIAKPIKTEIVLETVKKWVLKNMPKG